MNTLRPDEHLDNLHSIYVDQWDWEKVIRKEERNLDFLKKTVRRIYEAIKVTENKIFVEYLQIEPQLSDEIHFIHSEELLQIYPDLNPKQREDESALKLQLALRGEEYKESLMFHSKLLAGELPYTIGGGIGQSRLCMFLLRKAHIGEVQSSIWPEEMRSKCKSEGIELL